MGVEAICESDEGQRSLEGNKKLSELVSNYGKRLYPILESSVKSNLSTTILLGGGDRNIYVCAEAVYNAYNGNKKIILLRLDRHYNERDVDSSRVDPDQRIFSPHSGNGVTQAKQENYIAYDFLLAADGARNNSQCHYNSRLHSNTCQTKYISNTKFRIEPKKIIDHILDEINDLLNKDENLELIINLDADSFNNVPSSAVCMSGCVDAVWGFYILEQVQRLVRLPRTIRVAELSYNKSIREDPVLGKCAVDFATEILRSCAIR